MINKTEKNGVREKKWGQELTHLIHPYTFSPNFVTIIEWLDL